MYVPNSARVKLLHAFAINLIEGWKWEEEEKLLLRQSGTMLRMGAPVQILVTGTSFNISFSIVAGNKIAIFYDSLAITLKLEVNPESQSLSI